MNCGLSVVAVLCSIATLVGAGIPPRITVAPRNQFVLQNTRATFVCETEGSPIPEITWYRNRRQISPGRRKFRIVNMPNRSILRVIPSGRKDMNITCKADNGVGRPVIKTAMLKNLEAVPSGFPTITIHPTMRALFEGRETVMTCSADAYPAATIYWLRNDQPVDMSNPRFSMFSTGSLHISKVEESDGGLYECVAHNDIGTAYSEGANLIVRVQDLPPTFYTEPRDEQVPLGGSVNLTCAAAGRPKPDIIWRQNDSEIQSTVIMEDGTHVLTIDNVEETKNYTCFAFSRMGYADSKVTVYAINGSAPRINLPARNLRLTIEQRQPPRVRAEWDSSPLASKFLSGHIVQYYKRGSLSGDIREAFIPIRQSTFLTDSLDYDSVYDFTVTPMWRDPTKRPLQSISSTISTPTEVTTTESPLLEPRNVSVTDYDCNTGVVILNWEIPNNESEANILHYELWTFMQDGKARMIKVQEPDYAVTGLSSDQTYTFAVRAVDLRGPGKFGENVTVEKCENKLFAPKDIRIRRISKTSIEVSWVNPEELDREKIQGYKILYRVHSKEQDPDTWLSKEVGPTAMTILSNLTTDDVYEIRLQAKNYRGYSQVSEPILSPETSSAQVGVGVMFGSPAVLGTRARIICTVRLRLPDVIAPGTADKFSVVVVPVSGPRGRSEEPYITATFTRLPSVFELGNGRMYGDVYNRPLEDGWTYRVYVKAYTEEEGYFLVSEESDLVTTRRCQTNILTQGSSQQHSQTTLIGALCCGVLLWIRRDFGT